MAFEAQAFFGNLNRPMSMTPPYVAVAHALERLRQLATGPDTPFSPEELGADVFGALDERMAESKGCMAAEMKRLDKMVNHWGLTHDMGRCGTK